MIGLGRAVARLRACLAGRRPLALEDHQELLRAKREALGHAGDAAVRVKQRMENPRIRLIVQSVDGLQGAFRDKREQ